MRLFPLALIGLTGCALGEGEPFGLVSATLEARYLEREDRDAGDGFQKLTNEYQVRLEAMDVEIDLVELVAAAGEAQSFDPANPPPGYSLCHGGHCHADDGRLVDYEDVAAELAGGEGATVALRLQGAEADLLDEQALPLPCEGDCILGAGRLSLVRLSASSLEVRGVVRDGLPEMRITGEVPFVASLSLLPEEGAPAPTLETAIDVPLDDEHDPAIGLTIGIHPTAALFDGTDFASLPTDSDGSLDLTEDLAIRQALRAAWAEIAMGVHIARAE